MKEKGCKTAVVVIKNQDDNIVMAAKECEAVIGILRNTKVEK
jgi:hypothetical protein